MGCLSLLNPKSQEWFKDMRALNFILWTILITCVIWAGAIFFGPSLISIATSHFSKGRINLTGVEVSPRLKLSAAVVDSIFPFGPDNRNLVGSSRALTIDWKIRNGFQLVGSIGPSSVTEYGTLSSTNFILEPISVFNWSEVNVQFEFDGLVGPNIRSERGVLTGKFNRLSQSLEDMKLTLPKVHGEVASLSLSATSFTVLVDRYEIAQPLYNQDTKVTYLLQQVDFPKSASKATLVGGEVMLLNGEAILVVSARDIWLNRQQLRAGSLTASLRQSLLERAFQGVWDFSISEIELETPAINIANYSGKFTATPAEVSHNGTAIISKMELKTNQYFIGQIENGILEVALSSDISPTRIDVEGQGVLNLKDVDGFTATISLDSSLAGDYLRRCINQNCSPNSLSVGYEVFALASSLKGNLECEKSGCFNRPKKHFLQTKNTTGFFQALSNTGILSPLALPIMFMAVSSGDAVGDGHILNF